MRSLIIVLVCGGARGTVRYNLRQLRVSELSRSALIIVPRSWRQLKLTRPWFNPRNTCKEKDGQGVHLFLWQTLLDAFQVEISYSLVDSSLAGAIYTVVNHCLLL